MNDSSYKSIDFGALTRAGEGLTQWRALGAGFLTALVCCVLLWLMQWSVTRLGGIVGIVLMVVLALACFVVWVAGSSAVGVLLMDKARDLPQRSIGEAAAFGLGSVPKFLLLGVAVFVVTIAFMLVAALIYFICKIPVIGAVLAFVAHPVLLLIASAFIIACVWVVFPLFAPAVWSGLGFKQALASVFAIARHRLVQVVLMMMVLYIILVVIGMLIASGVVPAMGLLTSLATSIMGGGGGYGGGYGMGGMGGLGAAMAMFSSASMTGAILGASVLSILLFALITLVAMMGINLLYLQASDGLDTAGTSSDIEGAFGAMKERAREAADKARAAAERAKQAAADRAQAASNAREEAVMEQTRLEEEETNQPLPEQEALRREAAEREAREAQARAAQARAEAQREAEARAAAQAAASQPPAAPSASGAATAGAAALGGLMASAAAATGASPEDAPPATTKGCKACGHTIGAQDMFCENCGTRQ